MSFEQRFALVLLAAFFLASVATSLAAAVLAPRLRARGSRQPWTSRDASGLALVRLLPAGAALALTLLVLGPGYFEHEQRGEPEGSGYALWMLAFAGLWIIGASLARVAASCLRTAAIRRQWLAAGRPVTIAEAGMPAYVLEVPFPLVAVLGILRPRLFISRTVLDECSAPEMTAIVEHERAHVLRRDNALRLLMDAAPDLLGLTRLPRVIAAAWHQAVEHRADDAATRRTDLASALVKVARLATASPAIELPASALYRGEGHDLIGVRVRRLIGAGSEGPRGWASAVAATAMGLGVLVAAAALTGAGSRAAHAVLEITVSVLP
jgi:hypothetical protein